jgi:polyvinyl alcohol dehydrogenase (cytochrome)
MRNRWGLPLLLLLAILIAGCNIAGGGSSAPRAPHAPLSIYYYSGAGDTSLHAVTAQDGMQRWSYTGTPGQQGSTPELSWPVLAQHVIYLGDNGVTALNALDGKVRWHHPESTVTTVGTVQDGVVYALAANLSFDFASVRTQVLALSADTGRLLWQTEVIGGYTLVASGSAVYVTFVIVSQGNNIAQVNGLTVLSAHDGKPLWRYGSSEESVDRLQLANDRVYVVVAHMGFGLDERLVALDASTGKERWRFPQMAEVGLRALGEANGLFYLLSDENGPVDGPDTFYALAADTGSVQWRTPTSDTLIGSLPDGAGPYGAADAGMVYALNPKTGAILWQAQAASQGSLKQGHLVLAKVAAAAPGLVYLERSFDGFYALNADNGALVWRLPAQEFLTIFAARSGIVYASAVSTETASQNEDALYALDASTGAVRWKHPLESDFIAVATLIG